MIPTHEYDDTLVRQNRVGFKVNQTNIEKYISFFNSINNRPINGENYEYERCTLLIVDFSKEQPQLYQNSAELKRDGLISSSFEIEYATLAFNSFAKDILNIYASRYDIDNLRTSMV